MPKRIKKEDITVEYIYAEPQTEAERADAEHRVSEAFAVAYTFLLNKH